MQSHLSCVDFDLRHGLSREMFCVNVSLISTGLDRANTSVQMPLSQLPSPATVMHTVSEGLKCPCADACCLVHAIVRAVRGCKPVARYTSRDPQSVILQSCVQLEASAALLSISIVSLSPPRSEEQDAREADSEDLALGARAGIPSRSRKQQESGATPTTPVAGAATSS